MSLENKNDLSSSDDDNTTDESSSELEDPTYMPDQDDDETELSSDDEECEDEGECEDEECDGDDECEDEECEDEECEDEECDEDEECEDILPKNKVVSQLKKDIKNSIISMKNNEASGTHLRFDNSGQPFLVIMQGPNLSHNNYKQNDVEVSSKFDDKKRQREEISFIAKFTKEETDYWKRMSPPEKESMISKYNDMKSKNKSQDLPLRFKLLQADLDASSKSLILAKLDQFQKMPDHSGEYFKLRNWLNGITRLPLGVYKPLPIEVSGNGHHEDAVNFLKNVKKTLDKTTYGHNEVKNQLMRILAQWISNPDSRGNCIGLQGNMGCGKTSIIKQGLCTALGLPFGFVSLGGASDASFLDGHSFTYEGSTYGKIAEILMKTKCMNPILFFDELDKVSHTYRGEEIIGLLTHLTDSSQNERFNDRYFGELDLNLSKALIIFSYNDESKINPILKDRMITIRVPGYDTSDKISIASDYLIPELLKEYKRSAEDIIFSKETIEKIIERVPKEDGVRNLKRGIECIISWLNMHTYLPLVEEDSKGRPNKILKITLNDTITTNAKLYTYPVVVTEDHINRYIKEDEYESMKDYVAKSMYL
jgi:ATP-dependent Lon protease